MRKVSRNGSLGDSQHSNGSSRSRSGGRRSGSPAAASSGKGHCSIPPASAPPPIPQQRRAPQSLSQRQRRRIDAAVSKSFPVLVWMSRTTYVALALICYAVLSTVWIEHDVVVHDETLFAGPPAEPTGSWIITAEEAAATRRKKGIEYHCCCCEEREEIQSGVCGGSDQLQWSQGRSL